MAPVLADRSAHPDCEVHLVKWLPLIAPIPPVLISYLLARRKIQEIHVLVNNRLEEALEKIRILEARNGDSSSG